MSLPSSQSVKKFVRAGAGAGKTWNLTRQVVGLALKHRTEHGQWPKTVLTTFTRKATQELKERLLLYCLEEEPEAIEFVQSSSFLTITTMHGLLSLFLGRYGYILGLPNQLKVVDAKMASFWRKQILRNMADELKNSKHLHVFSFQRLLSYLTHYESIYWQSQAKPLSSSADLEVLMHDRLQRHSQNLKKIVVAAREQEPGEKWPDFLNQLENLIQLMEGAESWTNQRDKVVDGLSELKKPRKSKKNPGLFPDSDELLSQTLKDLKKWCGEEHSPQYWQQRIEILKEFDAFAQKFMKALEDKKKSEGALEPNDLEFYSLKISQKYPQIIQQFSQDVEAWFIDEFQDTSPLQIEILQPMIADRPCYMVGDPQQSIYLFRGSRSEVFFNMKDKTESEGGEVQFLESNYRSQAALLEFFNDFFTDLDSSFAAMNPMVEAKEGCAVECVRLPQPGEEEWYWIAHRLRKLIEQGVSPKNICILTRTHGQIDLLQKKLQGLGFPVISHASTDFYKRRETLDGMALLKFLLNPWDDKNLVLLLRSPWLGLSDAEIVAIIGEEKKNFWKGLREYIESHPDWEIGQRLVQAQTSLEFKGYSVVFRELVIALGLFEYSHQVDSTGRREANLWKLINLIEKNAREEGSSLLQLIAEGAGVSSLEDFGEAGDAHSPVEPNKIHLMTIHASKGLQFDYVFMPFLHKKPLETQWQEFSSVPEKKQWTMRVPTHAPNQFVGDLLESLFIENMKKREQEESLRVLYVGMTRAKNQLLLSWSGEPEKGAWAQLLVDRKESFLQKDHIHWEEKESVEAPEPLSWQSETQANVSPFDQKVSRFDSSPLSHPPRTGVTDWEQLKQAQVKRREGVVLHRLFEVLKTHDKEQALFLGSRWLPHRQTDIAKAMDFIEQQSEVPLLEVIAQGEVEWGYLRKGENDEFIEKRIDLWGVVDDTLWIIDYKTGSTDYVDKAFEQMKEYAQTLQQHLNWNKAIKLAAVYPFSQKITTKDFTSK